MCNDCYAAAFGISLAGCIVRLWGRIKMKYFVTGATGFIGGKLAEALIAHGHEVVALVRTPAKAQHFADKGIVLAPGDITDKESMRQPMTGVDGVFHVAAWYKIGEKGDAAHKINVDGTRNVLELMRELKIPKGVYTSTVAVFGDTHGKQHDETYTYDPTKEPFLSAYDETKWRAHYEVAVPMMQQGLPLVIVQPGLVYGTGDTSSLADTIRQYLTGKLPMVPQETAFMWAHVDDVVEGHILAMEKGKVGESYIICGERSTLLDALKLAESITGIPVPKMTGSPALFKAMSRIMSVVNAVVPIEGQYHPETLRVIAGVTYLGDNSKAKRELGYNPRPLREGLKSTLEDMMRELGIQARK
jgi:nucleoside-diphosphate-sugar epimerase